MAVVTNMSYALSWSNLKQQICEQGAVVFYATVLLLASSFPSKMLKSISFKWNWYNLINHLFSRTKFSQYWHLVQRQNSRRCPRNSLQKPRWLPRWFLRIDMHWWCCLGFKNIAKGTTDPRIEFISQDHSSRFANLEHITISESRLSINFKKSTWKHQHLD